MSNRTAIDIPMKDWTGKTTGEFINDVSKELQARLKLLGIKLKPEKNIKCQFMGFDKKKKIVSYSVIKLGG